MSERTENIWRQIIGGLLIASCSGSLGYGYSQSSLGIVVKGTEKDIVALHETDAFTNRRVDKLADALAELIKQNTELITLLRVQQQIGKP